MEENKKSVRTPQFEGEKMKMPENSSVTPEAPQKSPVTNGPVLFILAVVLLVILGGLYYWFTTLNTPPLPEPLPAERPTPAQNNEPESTTAEAQTDSFEVVSTSDELSAIEADLESTQLDSLDTELQTIDAELEANTQ